ncbi:MAG: hypothetical protein K2X87_26295 [Gemmataceae bacterium]|nr:hypothetical protein [Gemmataceae bacterium]
MDLAVLILLSVALVLGVMAFRLAIDIGWGAPTAVVLALIPPVASYFLGAYGLLGSAAMVGGMYKASAG